MLLRFHVLKRRPIGIHVFPSIRRFSLSPTRLSLLAVADEFNQLRQRILDNRGDLKERFQIYKKADFLQEEKSVPPTILDDLLFQVQSVPRSEFTTSDLQFAVSVLTKKRDFTLIKKLLIDAACSRDDFGSVFLEYMILNSQLSGEVITSEIESYDDLNDYLSLLGEACAYMGVSATNIENDIPTRKCFERICSIYPPTAISNTLSGMMQTNPVICTALESVFLKVCLMSAIYNNKKATNTHKSEDPEAVELSRLVWKLKQNSNSLNSTDLENYMLFEICHRNFEKALRLYDESTQLHSAHTVRPLLLAAAETRDYARLEKKFNDIEENGPYYETHLGSEWYSIILKALGYIGGKDLLKEIFEFIKTSRPESVNIGVYHALLIGYGVRGELNNVLIQYKNMQTSGLLPTSKTYTIVLQAFRDAQDLRGALRFVNEQILPSESLNPSMFSILLSLCGRRSDSEAAEIVWRWGQKFFQPNAHNYCQYVYALLSGNKFEKVLKIVDGLDSSAITINLLTVLLQAAARNRQPFDLLNKILRLKIENNVEADEVYYVAYLSFLSELSSPLNLIEDVFDEMRRSGIKPNASHYAIYTQSLADNKQFGGYKRVERGLVENHLPQKLSLISKHLHLLTAAGSSGKFRETAYDAAFALIKDGFFDPDSKTVPRNRLPVRVIAPVVRRLMKVEDYGTAHLMLNEYKAAVQREHDGSTPTYLLQDYELWGLYLQLTVQSNRGSQHMEHYWKMFCEALARMYVYTGELNSERKPVYKVAHRFRYMFPKEIEARIKFLETKNDKKLLTLGDELEKMGIAMPRSSYNAMIRAFLNTKNYDRAFELAAERRFYISKSTWAALYTSFKHIDYTKYGQLGESMHERVQKTTKTE